MRLSIGELSRLTGVPVKTLRFYSDEGLLPEAERSRSGYRLYTEAHVFRVDLIRTLREAGIGLEAIGKVLRRDVTVEEALRLRLGAVEAHVSALQRVAGALRAALRAGGSEESLRRLSMVTNLSKEQRRKLIERFYEKVMAEHPQSRDWVKSMIDASAPDLPDDPTPEQLDAWIELATLLEDETFIASMRTQANESWSKDIDHAAMTSARASAAKEARDALARGVAPESPEAHAIGQRFFDALRAAGGNPHHDPRADRYWELVGIMKGKTPGVPADDGYDEWRWLGAALRSMTSAS